MQTKIDLKNLVDAFRAQEQEKLDKFRAERAAEALRRAERANRCLKHLEAVWPQFVEIMTMLPGYKDENGQESWVMSVPRAHPDYECAVGHFCIRNYQNHKVELTLGAELRRTDNGEDIVRFYLTNTDSRNHACLGNFRGMWTEHPAEILIKIAEYIGKHKVK